MTDLPPARSERSPHRAAIFVDYANLHALLTKRLDEPGQAAPYIAEALSELRRYLAEEDGTDTVLTSAYADFGALRAEGHEGLQQALYRQGVEPRFVPASPQEHTAEVQLSIDATAMLHRRPDVATFALVTGDRTFLPLVQALRQRGAHAFVAALAPPPPDAFTHRESDVFMDFLNLLNDAARRALLQSGEMPARHDDEQPNPRPSPSPSSPASLDDDMLFRTLEITEEHFGQYDEVYLTPLLRKLSDVLGERFDPKALVSDLEDAGAVRLEKRRGYPYDYTVLIVNRSHPDVKEMQEQFYSRQRSSHERGGPDDHQEAPPSFGYDRSSDGHGVSSYSSEPPAPDDQDAYDGEYSGAPASGERVEAETDDYDDLSYDDSSDYDSSDYDEDHSEPYGR